MTIISLGGNCAVTFHLIQYNLRKEAFPFDWCKITINQLIKVFTNDFIGFENIKVKKLSENHLREGNIQESSYLLNNDYNIIFAHEVSNLDKINDFSNSLIRRITRFKNITNPTFIRLETNNIKNMNLYHKLINLLDKMFSEYKFILISKNNPNNNKIIWFELNEFSFDWKYYNIDWYQILHY